jgi:signal transduction histidine kinase
VVRDIAFVRLGRGWRPPDLLRTTNFRLTAFYAGSFSLLVLALFAIVAWSTTQFMKRQIDITVSNEIDEVLADSAAAGQGDVPARLAATVRRMARSAPGISYLLQDNAGQVVAGNMPAMPARQGLILLPHSPPGMRLRRRSEHHAGLRGRGIVLPQTPYGRAYLLVAVSDAELGEMQAVIARGFLAGLAVTFAFAVLSGLASSLVLLRRIEAISRTSREIMAGDLGRRIELHGSNDEFDDLAMSLNAMLDRIQHLMSGLQQISNDIAHDLRTPLSRMRQRLELALRRENSMEGLRAAMEFSIADTEAILRTFSALLRVAQIESGTRRVGFAAVAMDTLLEDLAEAYLPVVEERGQSLAAVITPGLRVRGDRELLTQAIANLIENAINHAPPGAALQVMSREDTDGVRIIVADNGPGIPEAERAKVLQRFYRLETSRTKPGQGLGLSLVHAIADLHDAKLMLEDNDPGLRCILFFPRSGLAPS